MVGDETRKQLAAGSDEQGFTFHTSFDPFNMVMQQLGKLDDKLGKLDEKIDTKIDKLDAKIDDLREETNTRIDKLDAKIDDLHKETNARIDKLDAKIDARVDGLQQEFWSSTRWIIGTIVTVAGVAIALASWLFR